jgi:hypothetical protein
MSESEKSLQDFLQRWSRRKLGLEERPSETPSAKTEQTEPAELPEPGAANRPTETSGASDGSTVEPFDLARLPPIEAIDATTDIRAFLAPGVPAELTRAALRRAWLSDPAIRDFIGLAENQWDFTNPDTVPGFGSLELSPEVRRLLTGLLAELPAKDADVSQTTPAAQEVAAPSVTDPTSVDTVIVAPAACPDTAPQNNGGAEERERVHVKPKHGGALPK